MKRISSSVWSLLFNGVLATCAVVVTTLLIRSEFNGARTPSQPNSSVPFFEDENAWEQYFTGGQRRGPPSAGVALVIFSDYECPACRMLNEQIKQYQEDSAYPLAILYRHWPLPGHRFALPAAVASECAAAQGRFEQMHDTLFANQQRIGVIPWTQLATSAGVADVQGFEECMSSTSVQARVQVDAKAAEKLDARGTPAVVVVGGSRFAGVPTRQALDSLLAAASTRLAAANKK